MAWRPITENDITPGESAGCTVPSEGTLVFMLYQGGTDDPDSGSYYAYFPGISGDGARLRVTPLDAEVQPFVDPEPSAEFVPARVAGYETDDELVNTIYTGPAPITEPLVGWHDDYGEMETTVQYLDFHGANTGGVYNEQTATFGVEIWDDGGAPPTFRPLEEHEVFCEEPLQYLGDGAFRFTTTDVKRLQFVNQPDPDPKYPDRDVRVTIVSYLEEPPPWGTPGTMYQAARMYEGIDPYDDPSINLIFGGGENGYLPDPIPPVDRWVPDAKHPLIVGTNSTVSIVCTGYSSDGEPPAFWSIDFKVEVTGDAIPAGGGCFWMDKVGVFEDCGAAPNPNPQTPFVLADVVTDHPYLMGNYGLSFRSGVVDALGYSYGEEFYIASLWIVEKDGVPMLGVPGFSDNVLGITEEEFAQAALTEVLQFFGATFHFDYNGGGVSFLRQTATGEALRASQLDSWAGGWEYGEFWLLGLTLEVGSTGEQFNILCTIGNTPA